MTMSVPFTGKPEKLIKELLETQKTPRAYKTKDYVSILEYLGFKFDRCAGDHMQYKNSEKELITFVAGSGTVDPKCAKRLKDYIQSRKLDCKV